MSFFDDEPRRDAGGGAAGLGRINFSLEPLLGIVPFVALEGIATGDIDPLTGSNQDVPGATVTLRHPGVWLIWGVYDVLAVGAGDNNNSFIGSLEIDGGIQAGLALRDLIRGSVSPGSRGSVSFLWIHRKVSLGPTVAQLLGRKDGGSGASRVEGGGNDTKVIAFTVPGSETLPT